MEIQMTKTGCVLIIVDTKYIYMAVHCTAHFTCVHVKNFPLKTKCSQDGNTPGAPDRNKCKTPVEGHSLNPTLSVFPKIMPCWVGIHSQKSQSTIIRVRRINTWFGPLITLGNSKIRNCKITQWIKNKREWKISEKNETKKD